MNIKLGHIDLKKLERFHMIYYNYADSITIIINEWSKFKNKTSSAKEHR